MKLGLENDFFSDLCSICVKICVHLPFICGQVKLVKLLFSEQKSDYEHYQFPYAIWAVPEAG
jgi:hypothetical protein